MYKRHGHTTKKGSSSTYKSWHMMKQRCMNPKYSQYKDYGGRGINIHPPWMDFANFLADMGERPEGATLDRIDNAGNYEPLNCRWSSRSMQQRNRRANRWLEHAGEKMLLVDWAKKLGLTCHALLGRLKAGWTVEAALTTPPMLRGRRKEQR